MSQTVTPYIKRTITKCSGNSRTQVEDSIAAECRLRVFINGGEFVTLHCTPMMLPELLNGLLLTEGILKDRVTNTAITVENNGDLTAQITVPEEALTGDISVSRNLGGFIFGREIDFQTIDDDFSIRQEDFKNIFLQFHRKAELFRLTGCFHSASLSDGQSILAFAEDIGRHNAVDKVIGHAVLNDMPFRGKVMLVSCRISSEIVSKCARWQVPILASRAAATELAIQIAEKSGMTLVGFARGESFNIYTNDQRILSAS
ncbi:MAG TPA: formate dehydrogenase accessory sulfurtransferase FdhD [Thermodesulfovibrionales bacterium]|nr:formate dehydrogenase accessory sulfurtransferase FdhD [Thermodesulfovibrionales bacterium]